MIYKIEATKSFAGYFKADSAEEAKEMYNNGEVDMAEEDSCLSLADVHVPDPTEYEETPESTDDEDKLLDLFKRSRRDNSKYLVLWETSGDGKTDWQVVKEFPKPMSKAKAVAVFFMQWMSLCGVKKLDDVRAAFPAEIKTYTYGRTFPDSLIWHSTDDGVTAESESGAKITVANDPWDFYPVERLYPNAKGMYGLGWGTVYKQTSPNTIQTDGIVLIAKMWRKGDFERLLKHIADHPELFARVKIEQV